MPHSKSAPYFTIIIPTLNEERYLPLLLENLNQQTYQDFEVFVVDGHSKDSTAKIVTSFAATYPLKLISTTKRNVSYQRNLGATKARGSVLIFFDADTQIPKNYLEKIHHAFITKRPHFLNTYMRVDSLKTKDQWFPAFNNLITEIGRLLKMPAAYGAAMVIKKTTFDDIGGFDEQTHFGEDSQLFQTALDYNYKYMILPSPRYIFSLRRFRSEGTLEAMYQYLRLNLANILNGHHDNPIKYPMGGHVHSIKTTNPEITRRFEKIFHRLNHITQEQSAIISRFINRIFTSK